jgi:putative membrane protein
MKKNLLILIAFPIAFGFLACNNEPKDSVEKADSVNESKTDTAGTSEKNTIAVDKDCSEFMVRAASGGMMEVELGKLAQEKAKNQRVKDFGAMMVRDHSKAGDELKGLAASKNVTLPTSVGEDHQKHMDDLNKKSGNDFDKAYIKMMVDDHKEDISDFEKASNNATDAAVKAWATKTLPTLRTHLDSAQAIHKKI